MGDIGVVGDAIMDVDVTPPLLPGLGAGDTEVEVVLPKFYVISLRMRACKSDLSKKSGARDA